MSRPVGRIELILGPMFAGKTTELIRRIRRAELGWKKCIIIKYSKDPEINPKKLIKTHDMEEYLAIPCNDLQSMLCECLEYDVIGIDEAQFFPNITEFTDKLAFIGKTVIVAGLDGTFQRKPFGKILNLIPHAETIVKLSAICKSSGDNASFTERSIANNEIELLGGDDIYYAICRKCLSYNSNAGEIHLIIGPVQCGKTTEIIRLLHRHEISGRKVVLIRHPNSWPDSHQPNFDVKTCKFLPMYDEIGDYDVIGVDEGQRYTGIADWANCLANDGKIIMIDALNGNEYHKPYPGINDLITVSEHITQLTGVCPYTGFPAPFTTRENNNLISVSRYAIINMIK